MLETSARLLRLLSLFQSKRYWSGTELAARLEVTSRTVRRDVEKLRALGYPIRSAAGVEGGYQLEAGTKMPPLLLDDEEAVAVALGLCGAAAGAVEGIEEAAVRARAKIEQILPSRLRRRLAALHAMIITPANTAAAVNARALSAIAGACRDRETLRFQYRGHAGDTAIRSVEPYRLVHTGRHWYLVAWDLGRAGWRTFRLDRLQSSVTPGPRFVPRDPPAEDLGDYVFRGMSQAPPCRARITIHAAAEAIASRLPPWAGLVEPLDDRTCVLETGASTYESLAMHLAFIGAGFEVTEPPEFVEAVRRVEARYRQATRPRRAS